MSRKRSQSTKDLGALLSETVPVLDEEDPREPADIDPSSSTEPEVDTLSEDSEAEQEAASVTSDEPADNLSAEGMNGVELAEDSLSSAGQSDAPSVQREPDVGEETPSNIVSSKQSAESEEAGAFGTPEAKQSDLLDQPTLDAELHFVDASDIEQTEDQDKSASSVSGDEDPEPAIEPITWRKSTIPFREDQYNEIGRLLAEFRAQHGVQLTIAELVRLGLDKQIQAFQDEVTRPELLVELYEQQQRESEGNQNLKHSRSRGLGQFLANS